MNTKLKQLASALSAVLCIVFIILSIHSKNNMLQIEPDYKNAKMEYSSAQFVYVETSESYKKARDAYEQVKSSYDAANILRVISLILSFISGAGCVFFLINFKKGKTTYSLYPKTDVSAPSVDASKNEISSDTPPTSRSETFNVNGTHYTITATFKHSPSRPTLVSNIEYMILQKMHKKCYENEKLFLDFDEDEIDETMERFVADGYMRELDENEKLSAMTVESLKNILRNHNLKVSGKKDELVQRILDNSELIDLEAYTSDVWYARTDAGNSYYQGMITAYTADAMDEIYEIVKSISSSNYSKAFELSGSTCKTSLIEKSKSKNGDFLGSLIIAYILTGKKFNQAIIDYCYKNIYGDTESSSAPDYDYFIDRANEIMSIRELDEYKECEIEKYSILCALDSKTCDLCSSMDGQIFNVSDAVIGKNFPPFHSGCRCTTIAHIED